MIFTTLGFTDWLTKPNMDGLWEAIAHTFIYYDHFL